MKNSVIESFQILGVFVALYLHLNAKCICTCGSAHADDVWAELLHTYLDLAYLHPPLFGTASADNALQNGFCSFKYNICWNYSWNFLRHSLMVVHGYCHCGLSWGSNTLSMVSRLHWSADSPNWDLDWCHIPGATANKGEMCPNSQGCWTMNDWLVKLAIACGNSAWCILMYLDVSYGQWKEHREVCWGHQTDCTISTAYPANRAKLSPVFAVVAFPIRVPLSERLHMDRYKMIQHMAQQGMFSGTKWWFCRSQIHANKITHVFFKNQWRFGGMNVFGNASLLVLTLLFSLKGLDAYLGLPLSTHGGVCHSSPKKINLVGNSSILEAHM